MRGTAHRRSVDPCVKRCAPRCAQHTKVDAAPRTAPNVRADAPVDFPKARRFACRAFAFVRCAGARITSGQDGAFVSLRSCHERFPFCNAPLPPDSLAIGSLPFAGFFPRRTLALQDSRSIGPSCRIHTPAGFSLHRPILQDSHSSKILAPRIHDRIGFLLQQDPRSSRILASVRFPVF